MEIKMYVDFDRREVLTETEFEERKETAIQELVDDKDLLEEYLEEEFDYMGDLFRSLKDGVNTVESITEKYEAWIKYEYSEVPFRFATGVDGFEEFRLQV